MAFANYRKTIDELRRVDLAAESALEDHRAVVAHGAEPGGGGGGRGGMRFQGEIVGGGGNFVVIVYVRLFSENRFAKAGERCAA